MSAIFRFSQSARFLLVLVPVSFISLLNGISDFLYLDGARYSDLTISHLPNWIYLRGALLEYGAIPFWSPSILSGFPFFADPLSGLWYLPGWLVAVWPQPWAINLLIGLHLVWGGWGLKMLLESQGLGTQGSWLGGIAFAMLPKMLAHFGAGHISLVFAVSWTPWLLWAQHRPRPGWIRPGLVLGVIFLADPRWAAYAGLVMLAYSAAYSHVIGGDIGFIQSLKAWAQKIFPEMALAIGISSPLLLPLFEFTSLSTRLTLRPADVMAFSLPPERLLGLLFPDFSGMAEWNIYTGGVVILLAFGGSLRAFGRSPEGRDIPRRFWLGTALLALVFSLGESIPVLRFWAYIPGANLLRVPPRAMFLFGIAMASLAGIGIDRLIHNAPHPISPARFRSRDEKIANLLQAGLGFFWLAFSLLVWLVTGSLPFSFAWGTVAGLAALTGIVLLKKNPASWWSGIAVFGVLIGDLAGSNLQILDARSPDKIVSEGQVLAEWLSSQKGDFRVYSPSYSLPQFTAAVYGLELADGVDPLQIRGYAEMMEQASGVPDSGYSVTVPPFIGEDISIANEAFIPDAGLLGEWNVAFVVSAFEISAEGLLYEKIIDGVYVYRNQMYKTRAREVTSERPVFYTWSPNRIDFNVADLSGPIKFKQPAYPRWLVLADGRAVSGQAWLSDLDSISFPPGTRTLSLVFVPFSLYAGLAVFLLAFTWLAWKARSAR